MPRTLFEFTITTENLYLFLFNFSLVVVGASFVGVSCALCLYTWMISDD